MEVRNKIRVEGGVRPLPPPSRLPATPTLPPWRIIIGNIATLAVLAVIVAVVIYLRLSGQIP
jgi:hypothetical protein